MRLLLVKLHSFIRYCKQVGVRNSAIILIYRWFQKEGLLVPLKLKNGHRLYLRNRTYDERIFSQIFIYKELDFPLQRDPETILDCGANIGLSTLYFKQKYPNARIISVEPESQNFKLLAKNTASCLNIQLLQAGVWNASGWLYLIDEGNGPAAFKVSALAPSQKDVANIEAKSIEDILTLFQVNKIDLLKMDIEGSEYTCFGYDSAAWIKKTSCIAIEIHEQMNPGCKQLIDIALVGYDYRIRGEYHIYTASQLG